MRRRAPWVFGCSIAIAVAQACGSFSGDSSGGVPNDAAGQSESTNGSTADGDSLVDSWSAADAGGSTKCDPAKAFAAPQYVSGLDDSMTADYSAHLSPDELRIVLARRAFPDASADYDLLEATRTTKALAFGTPTPMTGLNSAGHDYFATLTPSADTIYFASTRLSPIGRSYLFVAALEGGAFGAPSLVDDLDGGADRTHPHLARHAKELWMSATVPGNLSRIFRRPIAGGAGGVVGDPIAVPEIASSKSEITPVLSDDGLVLYWGSDRQDGIGGVDVWVATRARTTDAFGDVRPVTEVNSVDHDWPLWLSPDQCRLYFHSERNAVLRVWVASRSPN